MKNLIAMILSHSYGVVCKHCQEIVIDPEKTKSQKNLTDRCPHCRKSGTDSVEKEKSNVDQ